MEKEKKQIPMPEKSVVVKDMVSTVEPQEAPMTDEDFYWLMLEMNEAY